MLNGSEYSRGQTRRAHILKCFILSRREKNMTRCTLRGLRAPTLPHVRQCSAMVHQLQDRPRKNIDLPAIVSRILTLLGCKNFAKRQLLTPPADLISEGRRLVAESSRRRTRRGRFDVPTPGPSTFQESQSS